MAKKHIKVAIAYDFDGTLAPGNMQEHSFIPELGIRKHDFWKDVKEIARVHHMDEILAYMYLMIKKAYDSEKKVSKTAFIEHGRKIPLFEGVEEWFDRINSFGRNNNIKIFHYIVSSGLREIIEGTKIFNDFEYVFASGFKYDQHEVAIWPALAVNYTTKTQYLFRINKGIINSHDNEKINQYTPEEERDVPFERMIYIGDGETDVPAMKMIEYQGGTAIAVYRPNSSKSKDATMKLLEQGRASYIVPAKYSANSKLDNLVKNLLRMISVKSDLQKVNPR